MIARVEELSNILQSMGYYRDMSISSPHIEAYYKVENAVGKTIIIANAIQKTILTANGAREVKKKYRSASEAYDPENVLLVLLGDRTTLNIHGQNIICIDMSSSKVAAHGITKNFAMEKNHFIHYGKEQKAKEKLLQSSLGVENGHSGTVITWLLIAVNIYVFTQTFWNYSGIYGINGESLYVNQEYFRLFTYMFLHGSIRHLISNCAALITMDKLLGKHINAIWYAIIYITGGIGAGIVSSTAKYYGIYPEGLTVGASGSIMALLGAVVVFAFANDNFRNNRSRITKYALITLVLSSIGIRVDWACHIGGFITGCYIMTLLCIFSRITKSIRYIHSAKHVRNLGKRKLVCRENC